LVLLLCLLPIEHWRFPFNVKPSDLVLLLLTLYGFLSAGQSNQRLDFPLLLPMWIILLSSSIATLVGLGSPESAIAIIQEIYLFAWFIAVANVLKTLPLPNLDRLMKIWSVIACLVAITTLMGMVRIGPSIFYRSSYEDVEAELIRATGTYDNSNAAAVYLSISLFVLLITSWPVWLRSVLGLWLFIGMFATGSNGALLTTFGSLVLLAGVYLVLHHRRELELLVAGIGIGLAVVVLGVLFLLLSSSLMSSFGLGTSSSVLTNTLGRLSHSVAVRSNIMSWAWESYTRHPLGTGPNSFGSGLHSDYAAFLFERGPVGLIGWLLLIVATLFRSLQATRQLIDTQRGWQVVVLGAGFLACAVNAFSHEISHMRQVWLLMAFLYALSAKFLTGQTEADVSSRDSCGMRLE
jgi:hypothetical protein